MSMITATAWVPRGRAARVPTKYEIDEEELARISQLARVQLDDANEDYDAARGGEVDSGQDGDSEAAEDETYEQGGNAHVDSDRKRAKAKDRPTAARSEAEADDDLAEYNLSSYDTDSSTGSGLAGLPTLGNARALAFHHSNAEDPYMKHSGADRDDGFSDASREDLEILPSDNLLIAARVQDEVAHLEIYVYEDEADNLYVHHDVMLPSIPLCVEYISGPKISSSISRDETKSESSAANAGPSNYVAVGTFEPDIEIWDLDTVDCMYPHAILGEGGQAADEGATASSGKKKKKKKSAKMNEHYHTGPVLALAANPTHKTLLASASADTTVKLWDLTSLKAAQSYTFHSSKACTLAWNPSNPTVLLSGSYDRTVVTAEMRAPGQQVPRWGVESDIEVVRWNPHDSNYFFAATENGVLHCHDVRAAPASPEASKPVWRLEAHSKPLSCFDANLHVPGLLATGSQDKTVKLWNIDGDKPSLIASRNIDVGKVFSTTWAPDFEVAFRLAVAGSKGSVQIWDTSSNSGVRKAFAGRTVLPAAKPTREDRLVGVVDDSSDSEDESEEDGEDEGDQGWESMDEDEE